MKMNRRDALLWSLSALLFALVSSLPTFCRTRKLRTGKHGHLFVWPGQTVFVQPGL